MATAAISAQGTIVQAQNGTYTAVPESIRVDTPSIRTENIDVTNHDSAAGVREFIAGFKDTETCTVEGNWIPGNVIQEWLRDQQLASATVPFKILLPGASGDKVATFSALIESLKITANVGEQLRYTMVLKPSGAPVWGTT